MKNPAEGLVVINTVVPVPKRHQGAARGGAVGGAIGGVLGAIIGGDLGKVYPQLLVETCAAWLKGASAERRAIVEHALRSAIKRGEAGALALLGFGKKPSVAIEDVRFQPKRVTIGEQVAVSFALRSTARTSQDLLVDLAVHFVKANGNGSPKVCKLKRIDLPARGRVDLTTRVSLAVHTTRTPRPGRHVVDILVNGEAMHAGSFEVTARHR